MPYANLRRLSLLGAFVAYSAASSLLAQDHAGDPLVAKRYQEIAKPLLEIYCYDCHGNGASEGNRSFSDLEEQGELLSDPKIWSLILKNVRSGVMPPVDSERPTDEEIRELAAWVKRDVYKIDPEHPDPGRAVLRRLNRVEYQNTIRDLLGHEYEVLLHFPPDDTGYGFDTIGEVLTVSPMLTEKYLAAAESIVHAVVPKASRQPAETILKGADFVDTLSADQPVPEDSDAANRGWPLTGKEIHFHEAADLNATIEAPEAGEYELVASIRIDGQFEYNPLRSQVRFFADGEELFDETYAYTDGETFVYRFPREWKAGEHELRFEVTPLPPAEDAPEGRDSAYIRLHIRDVRAIGPTDRDQWVKPPGYDRIFTRDMPPEDDAERLDYAREVLRKFATKAFRRPADDATIDALAQIAATEYQKPDKTFEEGIGRAMIAILASPRFLYRVEGHLPKKDGDAYPLADEYALASRLSYFLWSTMPDDELFRLAEEGRLREQLDEQIDRMLADERSNALVENFAGQWLRSRDVAHVRIDSRAVIEADLPPPTEEELANQRGRGRGRGRFGFGRGRFRRGPRVEFDDGLRRAMRQETELQFAYIMREDRSLLELIDADYAFLNERLAEHYKIEGVEGDAMRLVELPEDSPRGGILTQGTLLTITSNPDRTSPVKRGLYVLDNILGTPPPPPPTVVPELEESADKFEGRTPSLREVLELHRDSPLCASCHARMDPLGLALENFNALGMWRDTDRQQPIHPAGQLISGEEFVSVGELKQILKENKRRDFYYCVTEKLMTYALGRGVEYTDAATIDAIVDKLDEDNGRFSALLKGVIHSPQFQRRREPDSQAVASN
jgi:mono/diheme cytochrome c family protein